MPQAAVAVQVPVKPRLAENVLETLWYGDSPEDSSDYDASQSLAAALGRAGNLKPLPGSTAEVLRLLWDPHCSAERLVKAIDKDAATATRLIQVANSAFFRPIKACMTTHDALVRLGNRAVGEIVLSVAALGMFNDVAGIGRVIVDHCMGVGAIARTLATEWSMPQTDGVFVAGMLSDVGKLFAYQAGEIDYSHIADADLEQVDRVHAFERMWVGWDHAVLGGHIVASWRLPLAVCETVAWHHQPGRAYSTGGQVGLGVALLRLADACEYQLRRNPELDESFVDELASGGAASYAGISRDVLAAMWPKLRDARSEMVKLLR